MPDPDPACTGLIARPGDTLIVALNGHISHADADNMRARLLQRIPGLADVVLITQAAAIVAYRPQAEEVDANA